MLADDEIVFRCNLINVADNKMMDYSAGHIETKEASILINAINAGLGLNNVKFYVGKSYRHLMILKVRNPKDYFKIVTTPPHDILGKDIRKFLPHGKESEMILSIMERARDILGPHDVNHVRADLNELPANAIWLWGQGTRPSLPNFTEKFGLKGSVISAVDLVCGIGRLAGLEII